MKYLKYLLIAVPISIYLDMIHYNPMVVFILSCLSIIPLAAIIGDATEQVALYTGDKIGGLLNATMGNVPELLIGIFAVKSGLFDVVKASIVGSILGNLLFVLGFSILLGGIRYKFQSFNKSMARANFIMLFYSLIGVVLPAAFYYATSNKSLSNIESVSISIAFLMLLVYLSGLVFSLFTHRNIFTSHEVMEDGDEETPKWSKLKAILILTTVTILVGYESEVLVAQLEHVISQYHIPEIFLGIIIIPIVGNVAEHASAIIMAMKNRVDLSLEIAIGSAMQIALFVGPLLVIISTVFGNPMNYIFPMFQILSLIIASGLALYICQDGKTTWLEGFIMFTTYVLLALLYFFI